MCFIQPQNGVLSLNFKENVVMARILKTIATLKQYNIIRDVGTYIVREQ